MRVSLHIPLARFGEGMPNELRCNNIFIDMYSKGNLNTSSEALHRGGRNDSYVVPVDVEQVEIYKKEKKRAKYEGLAHLYQNDYKPAVYKKAVEYRNSLSYKKKLSDGSYKQLEVFESTDELKVFGLGPYFFVQFQRRVMWLFFVLSLLEVVRIYVDYRCNGLQEYSETFSTYLIKSTLGNYDATYHISPKYDTYIMTIIPCLTYFIFFLFYLCWKKHYSDSIQEEDEDLEFVKPEKFCVEVEGFEGISKVREEDLQEFFSSFGPVYEVSLARQYDGKLKYFEELDELEEEVKEEELEIILGSGDQESLRSLKHEKDELNKYINTLRIQPSVTSAFIHYQFEKSKIEMLTYFNNHYLFHNRKSHSVMRSICCCCIDDPEPKYLFQGHKLYVRNDKVPEPEDLNWDSFEVSTCSKIFRVIAAILIIVLFLAVSCSIISLCSVYISSRANDCQGVTIPSTVEDAEAANQSDEEKKCYCSSNFIASFSDSAIASYCQRQLKSIRAEQAIQYGITFAAAIVNFLFGLIVDKIVNLTQPLSFAKGYLWKTSIYTIFIIFNTAFVPLLIYADIFGFKATNYVSLITIISNDLSALLKVDTITFYVDFEPIWYRNVSPIYTNYIIIDFLLTWVFFFLSKCLSNKESLEKDEGTILQKSMNEKITSWKLNAYVEASYFNLIMFLGVFLSAGIPVMIPLAFINIFSKYVTNRSLLQSNSTRIEGLSEEFNSFPFTLMPAMLVIANLFGAWMLTGNPYLVEKTPMKLKINTNSALIDRQLQLPFFIILALLIVFEFVFYNVVIRFCSWLASSCYDKKEVVHPYYTKEYAHYARSMSILSSYNPRNNKKYKNAIINMEKYLTLNDDKL